jgi:hypothetical protein
MSANSSSSNSDQIINDIKSLQNMEQQMFSSLDSNPNLSASQKQELVSKISKISNMRMNLYDTMGGMNSFFEKSLNSSRGTLNEQISAVGIIEKELKEARKKLEMMEAEKINKLRLVEINDYFGEKYAEHAMLMKVIILTLIPVIIFTVLFNKQIISSNVYYILVGIVAVIGGFFGWMLFFSIINRDNMNYQEYDWYFDASAAPVPSTDASNNDPWLSNNVGSCVGDACCSSNMTYDTSNNICTIVDTSGNTTTESFITEGMIENMISRSTNQNRFKQSNNSNFMPSVSESFINFKF